MSDKAPSGWQPIETLPDMEHRPGRMLIRATGWKSDSGAGITFAREWIDAVCTSNVTHLGIRYADIVKIMKDGDMDGIDAITHWMRIPRLPESEP